VADDRALREYKRREFLGLLNAGAAVTLALPLHGAQATARLLRAGEAYELYTGKIEMGQGARTLLAQAAAEELGLPVSAIRVVMGDTARTPDDGGTWASLTTPETVPAVRQAAARERGGEPHPPAQWTTLGRTAPHALGRDIVTGAQTYASDLRREGALEGVILRPPALRARLARADTAAAARLKDVTVVREGDFLGAAAPTLREARRAAALIRAEWNPEPDPPIDQLAAEWKRTATPPVEDFNTRYPPLVRKGDVEAALNAGADRTLAAYWTPFIAHAALETRCAIAAWDGDQLTVHCGKQAPFLVRAEVAKALGIPESRVRIISSVLGGGFGGKQRADAEIEAARLARAAGRPVRVHWTREEEFRWAYARPAAYIEIETAVDAQGRITAWRHRNYNAGAPGLPPPYDFADHSNEFWRVPAPYRQGSYRALASTANNFARESHMDERAAAARRDPVEYRLAHIADARLREALERGAALFKWPGAGKGCGAACTIEKNARLAVFAEVAADGERFRVLRLHMTADFGAALNPGNLQNQMMGGMIQGLGGALFEEWTPAARSLRQYRVPRFSDVPPIGLDLIHRPGVPSAGAGEAPIVLVAPALANALSALTGERRRALPLNR
jgi:isoquinoline 1-oxidoreductase